MIRVTILSLIVSFLVVYAWKDWFKALCGLIILTGVLEHPDMPKQLMGISGLNLWNILFLSVCLSWVRAKRIEQLDLSFPPNIRRYLLFYIVVVVVGVVRLMTDDSGVLAFATLQGEPIPTATQYLSEYLINTIKFAFPCLLIYSGCRSKSRVYVATGSILAMYVVLALLTIKAVKFGVFTMSGDALQSRAHRVLPDNVGFHRVNLSMMFSGAAWALFACREMISNKRTRLLLLYLSVITVLAMASTGGRMGYVTWGALSVVLILTRWRKLMLAIPLVAIAVLIYMPSVIERMAFGLSDDQYAAATPHLSDSDVGLYQMTSGRSLAWPLVLEKIQEAPLLGHGREAMINSGITMETYHRFGQYDTFSHPHNAYLQWILDNGLVGFLPLFLFYLAIIRCSFSLFRDRSNGISAAVGGICLSLVGALLIASFGSQSFYPREGSIGMWCAIGLMLRVYVERARLLEEGNKQFLDENSDTKKHNPDILATIRAR